MINVGLYALTVFLFGSSWLAVRWQVGVVPETQSVAYRFVLAALLIFLWMVLRRERPTLPLAAHSWVALMGATLFSLNFLQIYTAANYVTTGVLAVPFSTAAAVTAVLGALFLRQPVGPRVWAGIGLGVAGIVMLYWPEIGEVDLADDGTIGLVLALGSTVTFAVGTIVSARNHEAGMKLLPMTGWAMAYGAAIMLAASALLGQAFTFDPRVPFVASLAYHVVLVSVVGFACYFTLVPRIGAARTAYMTVLFPVIALALSTLFEGYQWTLLAAAGVALVLAGNVLVLMPARVPAAAAQIDR